MEKLKQIWHIMKTDKYGITDAIENAKTKPDFFEQYFKQAQQEVTADRKRADSYRRYYYDNDDSDYQGRKSLLGSLVDVVDAVAGIGKSSSSSVRKERKSSNGNKKDFYGSTNCVIANRKGGSCMQCPMFWHCTQKWY